MRHDYRDVIGQFGSSVAIVATSARGRDFGMVVTAAMSLELDPPLIAIALIRGGQTPLAVLGSGAFSLNLLSAGQRCVAELYADSRRHDERALDLAARPRVHGVPTGFGGVAELVCRVHSVVPVAAHDLVIASVIYAVMPNSAEGPLIRHSSTYRSLPSAHGRDNCPRNSEEEISVLCE